MHVAAALAPSAAPQSRAWSRGPQVTTALVLLFALLLGGCGSASLPEELVTSGADLLMERTEPADLVLALADAECTVRGLDEEQATSLADEHLSSATAAAVADAMVECVGGDVIAEAALAPFTAGASPTSLACAGARLDDELIGELVAGRLSGNPVPRAEVELAVVSAVSLCLEPEELRGRG